jgi:hypothetical protein
VFSDFDFLGLCRNYLIRREVVMNFFRLFVFCLAALLLGCEITEDNGDEVAVSEARSGTISGRAVKGVMRHAVVKAYAMEQGSLRYLTETYTDDEGTFTLPIDGVRGPVFIEVVADATGKTLMNCDAISDCGDVEFGGSVPVDGSFQMGTVLLVDEINSGSVAITPLTHLAAEWLLNLPENVGVPEVAMARSRVADVLQVSHDFAFQQVPDITDATELQGAENNEIGHAVMAAAFLEAEFQGQHDFMKQVAADFVGRAGQLTRVNEKASLHTVLNHAVSVADGLSGLVDLSSMRDSMAYRRDHQTPGVTSLQSSLDLPDSPAFIRSRDLIRNLSSRLSDINIDSEGGLMQQAGARVDWLLSEHSRALHGAYEQILFVAALMSVLADVYPDDIINGYLWEGASFSRSYVEKTGTIDMDITEYGQRADLTIEFPLTANALAADLPLRYSVSGQMSNEALMMDVDSTLVIDPLDTRLMPWIVALVSRMTVGGEDALLAFREETDKLLQSLHMQGKLSGSVSYQEVAGEQRSVRGQLESGAEVILGGTPSLNLKVGSFKLDTVSGGGEVSAFDISELELAMAEDASLSLKVDVSTGTGEPVSLAFSGGHPGKGELLWHYLTGRPVSGDSGGEPYGLLQLDFPASGDSFEVETGMAKTVIRDLTAGTELTLKQAGIGEGVLYAGSELIGTVSMDTAGNALIVLLRDGSVERLGVGTMQQLTSRPVAVSLSSRMSR